MRINVNHALQRGIVAHREGQIAEAERLYNAVLAFDPNHPDANHNLGLLTAAAGDLEHSLNYFKIALASNPQIEQFWSSYLSAVIGLRRLDHAEQILSNAKVHELPPDALKRLELQIKKTNPETSSKKITLILP